MSQDHGLPEEVKFCTRCVIPNTRATPCNEYQHKSLQKHSYVNFDDDGVCSACRFSEEKWGENLDWDSRDKELRDLLDQYRSSDGSYDCVVPGSGGKDSILVAHQLKEKYGMHPLLITWSPNMMTDIGKRNFDAWLNLGMPNFMFHQNQKIRI